MTLTLGVNTHPAWQEQHDPAVRATILDQIAGMGVEVCRVDYAWATLEPSPSAWSFGQLDTFVDEITARGMRVLPMIYWPPSWSSGSGSKNGRPANPADYGHVLGQVAHRYGDKLFGVEMWNEPDLAGFWSGTRAQFVDLLAGAYPVAKQMSPNTLFCAAAPTYLGLASNWFADVYATGKYGVGKTHDVQAIHPYMSPSDLPPNAPSSKWSIQGIPELQTLRASHGDTSPLWATEFGWSTHDNSQYGANVPNYKRGVSERQQAAYLFVGLLLLAQQGVELGCMYTDRDMAQTSDAQERNFGLLRTDNTPKDAAQLLTALHTLRDTIPAEPDPQPEDPQPDDPRFAELEARIVDLEARITAAGGALTG